MCVFLWWSHLSNDTESRASRYKLEHILNSGSGTWYDHSQKLVTYAALQKLTTHKILSKYVDNF